MINIKKLITCIIIFNTLLFSSSYTIIENHTTTTQPVKQINSSTISNKVTATPDNYKDALNEYLIKNSQSINEDNCLDVLSDFMDEYNLDYITATN